MMLGLKALACGFASLWFTLGSLTLLAVILVASRVLEMAPGSLVAVPFGLLGANLLAALVVTPKLRREGGLLVFHLALAALALLAGFGTLTALNGHVEVTEGAAFDEALVEAKHGPLHPWRLGEVHFVQSAFSIDYAPGMKRRETASTVLVPTAGGALEAVQVGDDRPLVVNGYRFYTSFNKGFAPILTYFDERGRPYRGAVHLPSYPLNDYKQGNSWPLPDGSRSVKLWLSLREPVYREDGAWRFRTPETATLVVLDGEVRREMLPGDSVPMGVGALRYEELRTWMGYTISYDPTTPWLVATAVAAALGFAWHAARRTWQKPWDVVGGEQADA